jgi:hypothetical protein
LLPGINLKENQVSKSQFQQEPHKLESEGVNSSFRDHFFQIPHLKLGLLLNSFCMPKTIPAIIDKYIKINGRIRGLGILEIIDFDPKRDKKGSSKEK